MTLFNANLPDMIGAILGFCLTLFVFSYAWGDNPFYKIASHLFVGVAAGYAALIAINNILLPQLIFPLLGDDRSELILALIYLIPSVLVLIKAFPRISYIGNPAIAFLVGVGAATAIGGAVIGTIIPQVAASIAIQDTPNIINAGIILVGTLSTLIYFHFSRKNSLDGQTQLGWFINGTGWIGQIFIAITFGALFAGVYLAALTALIERLSFLWNFLKGVLDLPMIG